MCLLSALFVSHGNERKAFSRPKSAVGSGAWQHLEQVSATFSTTCAACSALDGGVGHVAIERKGKLFFHPFAHPFTGSVHIAERCVGAWDSDTSGGHRSALTWCWTHVTTATVEVTGQQLPLRKHVPVTWGVCAVSTVCAHVRVRETRP